MDVVNQVSTLIGDDLVDVVDQTQSSLVAASTSARLVDDTLSVIGAIPFIGQQYQPEVPLNQSITQIAFSLEYMNTSLLEIQAGVQASGRKVDEVRWLMDDLQRQLAALEPGLLEAQAQLDEYQAILVILHEKQANFQALLPGLLNTIYTLATLVLIWVALSQVGLLLQGLQWVAPGWFQAAEESHEADVA